MERLNPKIEWQPGGELPPGALHAAGVREVVVPVYRQTTILNRTRRKVRTPARVLRKKK